MEQFDAIVVGGSVSGSPTASWLARKGHKVLLLEKAKFPRDTNSTHFIWPRGMSYLNRLGVAEQLIEQTPYFTNMELNIEGVCLRGHVPIDDVRRRFMRLHGDAEGVVGYYTGPRRYILDSVLLEHARKLGVEVREQTCVESVTTDEDGRVCGVRARTAEGASIEAKARVVVGADGRISSFAALVGARNTHVREKSTFAYYGYFSGIEKPELVIHKRGRFGTAIFPTSEQRHLVLVYGPTAWWSEFSRDAEENFHATYEFVAPDVAELVRAGKRVEPFKAMGRMVAFHRENWGNGWALVGDAGSFKDQWTAMGITHSLRDAELIAGYLDHFLTGRSTWDEAMKTYSAVRMADYEDYWEFVCNGAQMNPYTREQLAFLEAASREPALVNKFIAQVGDTVSFKDAIEPAAIPLSQFVRQYDPARLGYHQSLYSAAEPAALSG